MWPRWHHLVTVGSHRAIPGPGMRAVRCGRGLGAAHVGDPAAGQLSWVPSDTTLAHGRSGDPRTEGAPGQLAVIQDHQGRGTSCSQPQIGARRLPPPLSRASASLGLHGTAWVVSRIPEAKLS